MSKQVYSEALVTIETADGVSLAGAVIRPARGPVQSLPIVWVHGFTGQFYEPHVLAIGRRLAERGHVFVTGNNRGNNYGVVLHDAAGKGERLGGAAWEMLGESPFDIAAWTGYTTGLGFRQIVLVGHSLGGMKVAYYMATRQDLAVRGLVIASGPVRQFIGPALESVKRQDEAETKLRDGRGLELMLPFTATPADVVSAQTVMSGCEFRDVLYGANGSPPAVARIRCPLLAFLGSEETWLGTPEDLAWIQATAVSAPHCETRYFEGADHLYVGHELEVADAIGDWIASIA